MRAGVHLTVLGIVVSEIVFQKVVTVDSYTTSQSLALQQRAI